MKRRVFDLKMEKLTDDKLKITLSIDDLEERNINLHSFMYNSPESQDMFWELLQKAEKECGFFVDDSFIYVEASTSGSGNFTLLVTKTNQDAPVPKMNKTKKLTKDNIRLKRKSTSVNNNAICIYQFASFDDLLEFCNLCDTSILSDNKLYEFDHEYYLKCMTIPYQMIVEYAIVHKNYSNLEAKLSEYGKVVIEHDALQTLSHFFLPKKRTKKNR